MLAVHFRHFDEAAGQTDKIMLSSSLISPIQMCQTIHKLEEGTD